MKKRNIFSVVMVVAILALGFSFVGCDTLFGPKDLSGTTWKGKLNGLGIDTTFFFTSSTDGYVYTIGQKIPFTYTLKGKKVTITLQDTPSFTLTISGNTMTDGSTRLIKQ